jgi:hypothetical protein
MLRRSAGIISIRSVQQLLNVAVTGAYLDAVVLVSIALDNLHDPGAME